MRLIEVYQRENRKERNYKLSRLTYVQFLSPHTYTAPICLQKETIKNKYDQVVIKWHFNQ